MVTASSWAPLLQDQHFTLLSVSGGGGGDALYGIGQQVNTLVSEQLTGAAPLRAALTGALVGTLTWTFLVRH